MHANCQHGKHKKTARRQSSSHSTYLKDGSRLQLSVDAYVGRAPVPGADAVCAFGWPASEPVAREAMAGDMETEVAVDYGKSAFGRPTAAI